VDETSDAVPIDVTTTSCIVVGGGPAGVMLSYLLARAGVPVTLLEAHRDFERDFRGDTVHPSTLEAIDALGLSEKLHALPHAKLRVMRVRTPEGERTMADFSRVRTRFPYIMILPQARFLDFLAAEGDQLPRIQAGDGSDRAAPGRGKRGGGRRALPRSGQSLARGAGSADGRRRWPAFQGARTGRL